MNIENKLRQLLRENRKVCLLQTVNGIYVGTGRNPELAALQNLPEKTLVESIILSTQGDKFEHCIGTRYVHLDDIHFTKNAEVRLYHPLDFNTLIFSVDELVKEQSKKDYSVITGITDEEIRSSLQDKTILARNNDIQVLTGIRQYGLENNVHFYLVGSATGRAGPRQLVINKMIEQYPGSRQAYGNINLAAVSDKSHEEVFADVCRVIESVDSGSYCFRKDKFVPFNQAIVPRARYVYGKEKGLIRKELDHLEGFMLELTHGRFFEKLVRKEIYENNWFHQLS